MNMVKIEGHEFPPLSLLRKRGDICINRCRLLRPTPSWQPSDPLELLVPLQPFIAAEDAGRPFTSTLCTLLIFGDAHAQGHWE